MPRFVEAFVRHIERFRSPRTARAYGEVAAALFAFTGTTRTPRREDFEAFLARQRFSGRNYAPTTRNHQLCALRALAKYAVAEGGWPSDPTAGISFLREPPCDPAVLSTFEVALFFRALPRVSRPKDLFRDRAILALLFTLGLRVHELVGLDVDQVDVHSATLVSVRGKGGTVHDLPMEPSTMRLVTDWLSERASQADQNERSLFLSRRGTRLSTRSVQLLFERLRLAVGTKKRVTPHTARHSAATLALLAGADVASIGELLRHGDINTTRLYLRLTGERKRHVVRVLGNVIPEELRIASGPHFAAQPVSAVHFAWLQALNTAPIGRSIAANDNDENPFDAHGRLDAMRPGSAG